MLTERFSLMMTRHFPQFAAALALIALPAAAGSIGTTFTGASTYTGNMFDAVVGPNGITVKSLAVNVGAGPLTIDVYIKTGTYAGFDTTPGAWTLVSATAVTGLGFGLQTPVTLTPFFLAAGSTHGIYVTIDSNTNIAPYMYYSSGANTYSNADISLTTGNGLGGKFGSLAYFTPRTWNGIINYNLGNTLVPEPSSLALLALAAPGLWLLRRRYFLKY